MLGLQESASETPTPPPPKGRASGTLVSILSIIGLLAIALFTYFVIPQFVVPYFEEKPAQLEGFMNTVEESLLAYAADEGTFPPEDLLRNYKRRNKNLYKTRTWGMTTYRIANLSSPVAYIDHSRIGDPYAMPEQWAPLAYSRHIFPEEGIEVAVISSSGPNLIYDVRTIELRSEESVEALEEYVARESYDPTNGISSPGDVVRILKIPVDSNAGVGESD